MMYSHREKGAGMIETWEKVKGCYVRVDARGRVTEAVKLDENGHSVPAAPYRWSKPYGAWVNATGVKIATLRAGMSRGTYQIR